ncbi:acyl-CoA desaturase [Persicimonas caeni]|uniref:Acyl-CoA desaturase n=2 Tax=Persicimonas caeni TaxID=2292766 RepID=A0A4Y6Q3B6_PERCE|nr:acyl-CoA desaturase [Persicimonas caeni]QED36161.1 acyl-CoA desaturase [Persicimonas caeni]
MARFAVIHLVCLAAIWTGVSWEALAICGALYALRMFAVTGGYHRYFAHRTYKMGRVMQFIMAFLAETSGQKGVLWWAAHHRHHHKYSDQPEDVHSAKQEGFWYAHVGWIFSERWEGTDESRVKDLMRYPEIVWIDKYHWVPPTLLGVATYYFGEWIGIGGWQAVVVGFFWSTVLSLHATFTINSLAHLIGNRRYDTTDDSRNHWFLALITFGEGWHNNHHHYQASVNQGWKWWEYDITYYILKVMSWVGLVHDLRTPPEHVVEDRPHPKALARQKARREREQAKATASSAIEKAKEDASRWLDEISEYAHCRAVEMSEVASQKAEAIRTSARQAKEDASRRFDELSEAAHCRVVEMSDSATTKVEEIKLSAENAQKVAAQKVDEFARSFQTEPKPELG